MQRSFPQIAFPPTLLAIEVPDDRSLRLVVEERTGRRKPDESELSGPLGRLFAGAQEIVRASDDGTFEIVWDLVVCFSVRGDPFPKFGPIHATIAEAAVDDAFMGWVKQECHAEPDYVAAMGGGDLAGRSLRHWRVCTMEALFDVAALDPPMVRKIATI